MNSNRPTTTDPLHPTPIFQAPLAQSAYGVFSIPRSGEIAGGPVSIPSGLTHRPPSGLADWRSPTAGAETGPSVGNPAEKPAIEDTPNGLSVRTHYHKKLTEIYLVLEGEGHLQLDGELHPVKP